MDFTYKRKRFRRSLKTEDRRRAEKIEAQVKTQLVEGKWFGNRVGEVKSFEDLMDRYRYWRKKSGTKKTQWENWLKKAKISLDENLKKSYSYKLSACSSDG